MVQTTIPVDSIATPPARAGGLAAVAWITKLDRPLAASETGPLAGLTFAAKDNIDAAGMPTTAGCPAFAYQPAEHATVVHRLLAAGAQLAGKTNLDQFACGLNGTRSPYGAVPNAINPLYVSGGSSSGSAYVVATGQVDFAQDRTGTAAQRAGGVVHVDGDAAETALDASDRDAEAARQRGDYVGATAGFQAMLLWEASNQRALTGLKAAPSSPGAATDPGSCRAWR